ncbi:transglutaminase domain-containing protein [Paenibacillus filicis]|uniref:Transglutaminase domain-containing protein n=1 Tax=Paenibacillus gyeongsangnamensis TaxID=3388067 RepID=A0ABT4QKX5_9BACL|nr:transglutaminase domain-containing protein [Paenibacillus filicis]MCZ8517499.1 transglutaminase domain-containing protein [Paenibacillus filicis]
MINGWNVSELNGVTVAIVVILAFSVIQGLLRGASSSAKHLALMVTEGAVTLLSLFLAWELTSWLSPKVQAWLTGLDIIIPSAELSFWKQLYYTAATGLRDFSLLRYSVLFVLGYGLIKQVVYRIIDPLADGWLSHHWGAQDAARRGKPSLLSSLIGGVLGAVTGLGRVLMVVAVLFIFTTLFPQTPAAAYIGASSLYQKGATQVIKPVTGDFIASRLPVFTRAVEQEFSNILQRKYEVVDANVPQDIALAAKQVTAKGSTDEEKAKLLYRWVGTRISYDWDKVNLYETQHIWKEQTPQDTFNTKKGVCIDYSRLYAVMARSVGLEVKVVTGLGYDGLGGYGPHAWNEVYLSEQKKWVPLDSTWVASGGNWFNPPHFQDTHIKEA